MDRPSGARLRPSERLTTGAEYRRVFRCGIRIDGPLFSLVAVRNGYGYDRLGLAASRRVGGAVERNRAKRLLRESFRRHRDAGDETHDVVLLAKREITGRSQGEVDREYRERLRRLAARRTRRSSASAGDD